jgi:phosphatidylserine/phosphatidylglycerophosphate/cardiolipin synthase-like enzyme
MKILLRLALGFGISLAMALPVQAVAKGHSFVKDVVNYVQDRPNSALPATGTVQTAFSPDEGAEKLVISTIDSAHTQIRVLAYSFTSKPVVAALLRAKKDRGVKDIQVVVDAKFLQEDRYGSARAALSTLVNASIEVRVISVYAIHHDKVIIVDGKTVQTGSFNYSDAAAHRNSENVVVFWDMAALAAQYLDHFKRNYKQSQPYKLNY